MAHSNNMKKKMGILLENDIILRPKIAERVQLITLIKIQKNKDSSMSSSSVFIPSSILITPYVTVEC